MEKSQEINELAAALSAFQGEVKDVVRDKEAKGWDSRAGQNKVLYKYGDIQQVLEVARPLLSKHGLAVAQLCGSMKGEIVLETMLMHSSGQWIMSTTVLPFEEPMLNRDGKKISKDAQSAGGSISYARRYALCSIVGIAQMDDDLSPDMGKPHSNGFEKAPVQTAPPAPKSNNLSNLMNLIAEHGIGHETVNKWKEYYKVGSLSKIPEHGILSIMKKISLNKEKED